MKQYKAATIIKELNKTFRKSRLCFKKTSHSDNTHASIEMFIMAKTKYYEIDGFHINKLCAEKIISCLRKIGLKGNVQWNNTGRIFSCWINNSYSEIIV